MADPNPQIGRFRPRDNDPAECSHAPEQYRAQCSAGVASANAAASASSQSAASVASAAAQTTRDAATQAVTSNANTAAAASVSTSVQLQATTIALTAAAPSSDANTAASVTPSTPTSHVTSVVSSATSAEVIPSAAPAVTPEGVAASLTGSSVLDTSSHNPVATPFPVSFGTSATDPSTFVTSTVPAQSSKESTSPSSPVSSHGTGVPASSSSPGSEPSALPELTQSRHHNGMSSGAMAAAVVIPLLVALALLAIAFVCLRRRSKQGRRRLPAFVPAMKEKFSNNSLQRRHIGPAAAERAAGGAAPVVTSQQNNAYFTGLDTSSQGDSQGDSQRDQSGEYYAPGRRSEGGTFLDPPPPYKAKSGSHRSGGSVADATAPAIPPPAVHNDQTVPQLREPETGPIDLSPFNDAQAADTPTTPTQAAGGLFVAPPERPQTSRSTTNRSINSDLYSDTASVHSARAARLSIGAGQMIIPTGLERGDNDPFGDPESPVSDAEEYHSLNDGGPSRAISPVSEMTSRNGSIRR